MRRLEEPCGIPSAPALLQLSRFAARNVKVVLSGQGADEPHGGYGRHQAAAALGPAARLGPLARPLRAAALRLAAGNERARRAARLLEPADSAERLVRLVEITADDERAGLVGSAGAEAAAERAALASEVLADVGDRGLVEQALYLDTRMFLAGRAADLRRQDVDGGEPGAAGAVPRPRADALRRAGPAARARAPAPGQAAAPRAMARLLPREIVDRPKHGFSTPYDTLAARVAGRGGPARATRRASELSELVDGATVARLVAAHRSGRADHKRNPVLPARALRMAPRVHPGRRAHRGAAAPSQ